MVTFLQPAHRKPGQYHQPSALRHLEDTNGAPASQRASPQVDASSTSITTPDEPEAPQLQVNGASPATISVGPTYADFDATISRSQTHYDWREVHKVGAAQTTVIRLRSSFRIARTSPRILVDLLRNTFEIGVVLFERVEALFNLLEVITDRFEFDRHDAGGSA
jgi:hypothetical protein